MKKILSYAVAAQFCAVTCLVISCQNDDNTALYYYSGDQKIDITISGDTLGFLLKDTLLNDPGDTAKSIKNSSQFFDSHFSTPGYSIAGNLTHDSISYNHIKLLKAPGDSNSLKEKENAAQGIKKAYPNIIGHAGYLIRVKSTNQPLILTDEIIVEFNKGTSQTTINNILQDHGLQIRRRNPFYELQVTAGVTAQSPSHALQISQQLKSNASVKYAQLNFIHIKKFHSVIPGDEFFLRQWHHRNLIADPALAVEDADIDADLAWDFTRGSANTILAIFDYDMDINHDDLKNNLAVNLLEIPGNGIDDDGNTLIDDIIGWNFNLNSDYLGVTGCEDTQDDCFGYHGTAVMGVAAAQSNEIGVTGICPECKLLPVRTDPAGMFDADGHAFDYAITRGAKILSLSWDYAGAPVPPNVRSAFERATTAGIVVFVSMSNADIELPDCVANGLSTLPNTIAVSGSNSKDEISHYGWGSCLDILAPTAAHRDANKPKIVTTDYTGDTGTSHIDEASGAKVDGNCNNFIALNYTTCFGGTSASTPLVAGVAGLILSVNQSLTPKQVQYLLQDCADKIEHSKAEYSPQNGRSTKERHGYGRLNAYEAVKIASPDLEKGGRNGVDIFLRDNELDWGNTEKPSSYLFEPVRATQGWWKSQDIKVDAPDALSAFVLPANSMEFEAFPDESPAGGKINKVYVRVRNRGFRIANAVTVKLYWVHAGAGLPPLPSGFWDSFPEDVLAPSEWKSLGPQPLFNLEYSGESVANLSVDDDKAKIVTFDFPAPVHDPSTRNHYCLMAVISSPGDLMPTEALKADPDRLNMDYVTTHYNNATHRNYNIVTADAAFSAEFFMYNPLNEETYSKLEVSFKGQKIPVSLPDSFQGKIVHLKKGEKKLVKLNIDPRGLKEPTEIIIQQSVPGDQKDKFKIIGGINYFIVPPSNQSSSSKGKK